MDAQIHAAFTGRLPEAEPRRKSQRRASAVAAVLTPVGSSGFDTATAFGRHSVTMRDWSADGVGLISRIPLDVCTVYEIEAESSAQLLPGQTLRVVACNRNADGMYRIGAVWFVAQQARIRAAG